MPDFFDSPEWQNYQTELARMREETITRLAEENGIPRMRMSAHWDQMLAELSELVWYGRSPNFTLREFE